MSSTRIMFADIAFDIAKQFLHTVVVVDDRAAYTEDDLPPSSVNEPGMEQVVSEQEANKDSSNAPNDRRHNLNAKEMIDAFAEHGLVCAILRPEDPTDKDVTRSTNAADRADLVVLDWQINSDNGMITKRIIQRILDNDDGRLRLIAIYTGEPDLVRIAEEVEEGLKTVESKSIKDKQNPCTMNFGRVRIEIFAKNNNSRHNERNVSFQNLPEKLIACFAQMTAGLVSNAAVTAISAIRSNTHKLLSNLHKDLSGAYLAQRALTKPEDAFEFLGNIVASELHSILEGHSLEEHDKAIESWVAENNSLLQELAKKIVVSHDDLHNCLVKGTPLADEVIKKHSRKIATILCGADAPERNAELAILTMVRSRYSTNQRPPILSLGTIVASITNDNTIEYCVCVQPRCDSVRLDGDTIFPFLALESKDANEKFSFVIRDNNNLVYLKVVTKTSALRTPIFKPLLTDGRVIRATSTNAGYEYQTTDKRTYRWVANLKEAPAQRVVQQLASHLSRVGLSEMEWLRLTEAGKL